MKRFPIVVAVLAGLAGAGWFIAQHFGPASRDGILYGNIEIRQVDLAFNSEGTVTEMHKREGDPVKAGETLAMLDDATYRSGEALAEARRDSAKARLDKLVNGTRPEEIDQARANLAGAQAGLANAQATYSRQANLAATNATTRQLVDDARRGLDSAQAQVAQTRAALAELVNGPRAEDIAAARAQLRESEAALELARTQVARTVLKAPSDGIVMTRVIEPGTVVLPGSVVYSVAITGEVWVRAFVPEPMLARVAPDTAVQIVTDGRPNQPYGGRIGYVSPSAEFTPKTVETPELRTQLVYRIRIRVTDPDSGIRRATGDDPAARLMNAPLARIEGFSHGFAGRPALRDISAIIAPGLITGLIGPDAAGKTTLLRLPLLDEPSVGVDPASRRELWAIVSAMLEEGRADGMGVVWATAYLDEAARCGRVLLLHEGTLLADAPPGDLIAPLQSRVFRLTVPDGARRVVANLAAADPGVLDAVVEGDAVRLVMRQGTPPPDPATFGGLALSSLPPLFEDGFVARLDGPPRPAPPVLASRPQPVAGPAIAVRDLVRRFGTFVAVDRVSFQVARGEIFGLLGPNGAGKSTTFRMLCGLLRPSAGNAQVAGQDLLRASAAARSRIGYMAQRFSLYAELSVLENLRFFARIYGLDRKAQAVAIDQALDRFDLQEVAHSVAGDLPLGVKQRLALAASLLHGPDILFLDEPTSGVDPVTRRAFWARIGALADSGVAVLVTSHFMDEAEYCDRLGIISEGRLIATDTPAGLRARVRTPALPEPTLEDAFIALVQGAREQDKAA